ncbi:S41 family peptidase [Parvularcula lutaonensis]|uniref:Tricorn protease homolog n=1 Tax=Parvularcula lutaonensis TaxID=491923 RepID=A0ABV7M715_9PROT|nr:S41 family peptidase [Parvularcula lutaonensis]GGY56991.1 tricorn protease [Parvularcula lutaonensis]
MRKRLTTSALALTLMAGAAHAETLLLGDPAISGDRIAFTYAGDIYVADRDGQNARRLTSHQGSEHTPHFSPDGSMIAFTGDYDGNQDVYVVDADGGVPKRLTWHGEDDIVQGWSADGSAVAFSSPRETNHGRSDQLYHVSPEGGMPVRQMDARFVMGDWHEDGEVIAYIPTRVAYNGLFGGSSGWTGYRGGASPSIIVLNPDTEEMTEIPGDRTTEIFPMFHGDDIVFLSDRDDSKRFNVYRWDAASQEVEQLTDETDWDIIAADIHGDTLIFERGGRLALMDLDSGEETPLQITLNADLPQLQPGFKDATRNIETIAISPTGKRAIVTARGDVFTLPVKDGSPRNLTAEGGDRAYSGLWSPDGQRVAYVHDDGETQRLVLRSQVYDGEAESPGLSDGIAFIRSLIEGDSAEAKSFDLGDGFHQLLAFTPDSESIILQDDQLRLRRIDLDDGDSDTLATHERRAGFEVSISPDGRWLATSVEKENFMQDLVLIDLESGRRRQVTVSDGMADTGAPAFSRDGKYLYFTASTNSGPAQVGLDLSSQEKPYRAGIYVAVLSDEGMSPMAEGKGDEPAKPGRDDEEKNGENGEEDTGEEVKTDLDTDDLITRIVALPVPEASYYNIRTVDGGDLLYLMAEQPGAAVNPPGTPFAAGTKMMRFSFDDKKASEVTSGVFGFEVSHDGKHMIAVKPGGQMLVGETKPGAELKPLDSSSMRVMVDPRQEWEQIFDDVVRMEAKYFYDPDMHGLDWQAMAEKYRPFLDHVGRREDLNTVLVQMIAEMQVGHNRVGGGDVWRGEGPGVGLLGADLSPAGEGVRIDRIYSGEAWNPFLQGPLAEPGLDVEEGDFILTVNGKPIGEDGNIFMHLQGTAGQQVVLGVADNPEGRGLRPVTVKPVGGEGLLRLWSWVEDNRRMVEEETDGRVGYVYLPNTAGAGYTFFNRMFFPQSGRDGMIIDERSNGGGQAANYITDVLGRSYLAGWKDRVGAVFNTPGSAHYGPKVMLIDQDAGSGGDFLPYAFREEELGTLMGTRTWGGLIGISANPSLIDGGFLTVPYFRFFDADGEWSVENEGVAPDVEVKLDPVATNKGEDSQLNAAIDKVMEDLEGWVDPVPDEAPAYPTELGQ